jgi:hypothetical protein
MDEFYGSFDYVPVFRLHCLGSKMCQMGGSMRHWSATMAIRCGILHFGGGHLQTNEQCRIHVPMSDQRIRISNVHLLHLFDSFRAILLRNLFGEKENP